MSFSSYAHSMSSSFLRLKDSDVTWLYGPLHEAPHPVPPKGASLEDKLNIIPPLPRARKPILKKRTLAEVLVLGLAKTNNLPTPTRTHADPDELKELDIDSRGTTGPEQRDRIMLLHTKSDTNLLRPAINRVQSPTSPGVSPAPAPAPASAPRRSSMRTMDRSHLSNSTNTGSVSPPPTDYENGPRKRVGFNAYVSQCIAIAPGERDTSDDEDDDALSMKSGGSGSNIKHGRPSMSRSNSHSSARSEPLIIAPMAPALLKETLGDSESSDTPALIYKPIETPFDSPDIDDDFDDIDVPIIKPPKLVSLEDLEIDNADLGGDYITSKKRKLSAGEVPPATRPRKSIDTPSSISAATGSVQTINGAAVASSTSPTVVITLPRDSSPPSRINSDDNRGRTLQRTSSGSSLNERSRSRNGSSPMGSRSPDSSRASSNSNPRGSTEPGLTIQSAVPKQDSKIDNDVKMEESSTGEESSPSAVLKSEVPMSSSSKQDSPTSGIVGKAAATARGLLGTLLNGSERAST